ncbi:WD40 repeat-containing protein [Frankia torreyi]|uniref:WD40 repeat-containing protein n=4 Tax=Frankia TaxID=1854 RepID=A0A0D8B7N4_9ACTN|nr:MULTISPECIES: AAA family ATPase [Frankia]KJE20273.1 WD40 repeat-containing protein [Frankia torreyi]
MGKIFIGFHEADGGPFTKRVIQALTKAGYADFYSYTSPGHGPRPGQPWRADIRRNLLQSEAFVAITTPGADNEWCISEVALFRERKPAAPFIEIVVAPGAPRAQTQDLQAIVVRPDDDDSVATAMTALVDFLRDSGVRTGAIPRSPFPGLKAFDELDGPFFFGRERDVTALLKEMSGRGNGAMAVIGPSGVGKSSLVRAGLLPRLRSTPTRHRATGWNKWLIIGPVSPSAGAVAGIAQALAAARIEGGLDPEDADAIESRLRAEPASLVTMVSELLAGVDHEVRDSGGTAKAVIVLDQAEELVAARPDPDGVSTGRPDRTGLEAHRHADAQAGSDGQTAEARREAQVLTDALVAASNENAWLVYTIRADYLDLVLRSFSLRNLIQQLHVAKPLDARGLLQVVNDPVAMLGWSFDTDALATIVEDAGRGSLPLLAFALQRLWEHVDHDGLREPRAISLHDYLQAGRVQDVLESQANDAFETALRTYGNAGVRAGLPADRPAAERRVLNLLGRLASVGRDLAYIRRPVPIAEFSADDLPLLEPFVRNRVLTTTRSLLGPARSALSTEQDDITLRVLGAGDAADNALEVAHESLFTAWQRLRDHLDQLRDSLRSRGELEETTAAWVRSGRRGDDLIVPSRLYQLANELLSASDVVITDAAGWGWRRLVHALAALDVSADAVELVGISLQRMLDQLVQEAMLLARQSPEDALRLLTGRAWSTDPSAFSMILSAPDLTAWRDLMQTAEASSRTLCQFSDGSTGMWGVAWSPDDTRVVTGSRNGRILVWDVATGTIVTALSHGSDQREGAGGWVRSVAWSPVDADIIASTSTDETTRVWSVEASRELRLLSLPDRPWSVRFGPTGAQVLTACASGHAVIWNFRERGQHRSRTLTAESRTDPSALVRIWDADVSPDAARIAAAREDGWIDLWSPDEDSVARRFHAHPGATARAVRFSPDGSALATGAQDNTVRVFDLAHLNEVRILTGHTDQVRRVSWSPRGDRLASASADTTVGVWDVHTGERLLTLRGHQQGVCDVAWSHHGDQLLSVADDGTARVWKAGAVQVGLTELPAAAQAMDRSSRTGQFAVAVAAPDRPDANHEIVIMGASGDLRRSFSTHHGDAVRAVAWSPDGTRLLTASRDSTARIWRLTDTAIEVEHVLTARGGVEDARWSPDGTTFATAARDRVIRRYAADGRSLDAAERRPHPSFLRAVAWHPVDPRFALVAEDTRLTINTAEATVAELGTDKVLTAVAWSPGGDRLGLGATDGTVIIVAATEGDDLTELHRLSGHADEICSVAWSADGRRILTASADRSAAVWDAETGARITVLIGHAGPVTHALWTDQDDLVTTVSTDGTFRRWDVSDAARRPLSGLPTGRTDGGQPAGDVAAGDVAALLADARLRIGQSRD